MSDIHIDAIAAMERGVNKIEVYAGDEALEAKIVELRKERDDWRSDARKRSLHISELEAALKEAEGKAEGWRKESDSHGARATHLENTRDRYEALAERLKTALEEIAEGRFYCADGDCRAIETAQAALSDEEGKG